MIYDSFDARRHKTKFITIKASIYKCIFSHKDKFEYSYPLLVMANR